MRFASDVFQAPQQQDTQIAGLPALIPAAAAAAGMLFKAKAADRALGVTGTSGGDGTLDAAIERGELGTGPSATYGLNQQMHPHHFDMKVIESPAGYGL